MLICFDMVSESPSLSQTVRLTMYVSLSAYLCVVFCSVLVFPSPNSQYHSMIVPSKSVDKSVNCIVSKSVGLVGVHLKLAVGGTFATVICLEIVSVAPSLSSTVNVTV